MVKFTRSASAAQGSHVRIPGVNMVSLVKPCCGRRPTNSRGRWTRILAQGQSCSAKRGGLVADVSSGLIFLKKKKDSLIYGFILFSKLEKFYGHFFIFFSVLLLSSHFGTQITTMLDDLILSHRQPNLFFFQFFPECFIT